MKMLGKCLFQDCWPKLKDGAYQDWVLKDRQTLWLQNLAQFLCFLTVVMVLTKPNIDPYKSV